MVKIFAVISIDKLFFVVTRNRLNMLIKEGEICQISKSLKSLKVIIAYKLNLYIVNFFQHFNKIIVKKVYIDDLI